MNEIEAKKLEIGNACWELWLLLPENKKSYTHYYQEIDRALENWHFSEHNESIASDRVWHGSQGEEIRGKIVNKNLIMKFCDMSNERFQLPFSLGDYTYATDGRILIKIPRMDEFPENPKAPDPEKLEYERNPEKWYPVKDIRMPKRADCEVCGGEGTVWLSNNYSEYPGIDCNYCRGSGKVAFCEECDGTGKTLQQNPVDFHGVTFDQNHLALLSKLSNCEIGLISKTATTPFRFDDGSGMIMPTKYPDNGRREERYEKVSPQRREHSRSPLSIYE